MRSRGLREAESYIPTLPAAKQTRANANMHTVRGQTLSGRGDKHSPAAVDSERQNLVVEALFRHADDLILGGDLSALQALVSKQRDGGDRECLEGRKEDFSQVAGGENAVLVFVYERFPTIGTTLRDRTVKSDGQPMLARCG